MHKTIIVKHFNYNTCSFDKFYSTSVHRHGGHADGKQDQYIYFIIVLHLFVGDVKFGKRTE